MTKIRIMELESCGKAIINHEDINKILSLGFSKVEIGLRKENFREQNYRKTKNFLTKYLDNIYSVHTYHCGMEEFPKMIDEIIDLYSTVFQEKRPVLVLHSYKILTLILLEYFHESLDLLKENDVPFCIESQPGDSLEFLDSYILPYFDFCLDIAHVWISSPRSYDKFLEALLRNWSEKIKVVHVNSVKIVDNIPMDNQPLSRSSNPPLELTLSMFKKYIKQKIYTIVEVPPEYQKESKELLISIFNKV